MASTFAGSSSSLPQASGLPSSMLGFGPSASPFYAQPEQAQRLQYYSSQQQQQASHGREAGTVGSGSRRTGKVKFFDTQKGFGFINDYRPDELGNEEVFVHYTSITAKSGFRSLAEGEEAEYDIIRGPKGYQAANVTGPGGQQVVGDTRGRQNKNAFLHMSPYAAMYPYIQQDPSAFYAAASPYNQPVMLMPPQTDYRSSQPHSVSPAAYRTHLPYPGAASPYPSPAPMRPYDIGKDFSAMNFGSLSLDDGSRSARRPAAASAAPFGGMFGAVPGFDTSSTSSLNSPYAGLNKLPSGTPQYKATDQSQTGNNRSNSLEDGDKVASTLGTRRESQNADRQPESSAARPANLHSRSSSLLYASKTTPSTAN